MYSLDSRAVKPQTCFVDVPNVEYARSGEVAIAYQVFGKGPVDLVFARGFAGDLLTTWEQPLTVSVSHLRSRRAWTTYAS